MVFDAASKAIPTSQLPPLEENALLILYLRYTMGRFSYLPQAWILYLMSRKEERRTFQAGHIQQLSFNEGDIICGMFKVVLRTENKAELELKPLGSMNGRLVISIEKEGEETIFGSDTIMWKPQNDKTIMPLERALPKFMHEFAAWGSIDSGIKYLSSLRDGA